MRDPREFLAKLAFVAAIERVAEALGDLPVPIAFSATMTAGVKLGLAIGVTEEELVKLVSGLYHSIQKQEFDREVRNATYNRTGTYD